MTGIIRIPPAMKERIEKSKIEESLFSHYSVDWVQKPLDFIPNFHC